MVLFSKAFFSCALIAFMANFAPLGFVAAQETTDTYLKDFIESCGKPDLVKSKGEKLALVYDTSIKPGLGLMGIGALLGTLGTFLFIAADGYRDGEAIVTGVMLGGIGGVLFCTGIGTLVYHSMCQGKPYIIFDAKGLVVENKRVLEWHKVDVINIVERVYDNNVQKKLLYKDRFGKVLFELGPRMLPVEIDNVAAISNHYVKKIRTNTNK